MENRTVKKGINILLFVFIPLLIMLFLHRRNYQDNIFHYNFNRKILDFKFTLKKTIKLRTNCVKFIGKINQNIYLVSENLYGISKVAFNSSRENEIVKIKNPIQTSNIFNERLYVYSIHPSNSLSIYDKNLNLEYQQNLHTQFDRGIFFKNTSYFRFLNEDAVGQFKTIDLQNNESIKSYNVSNVASADGGITTDGYFISNNEYLIYIEYHRGNFYKLDSNKIRGYLMPYKFDSVRGLVVSGKTFTINRPIIPKNKFSYVYQNYLYNASFVKSNEQTLKEFTNNIVIDVYDLDNGKYLYSFYLPNDKSNHKPKDILLSSNNTLYVLYGKEIYQYKFWK